jgi:hypothetical protein
MLVQTLVPKFAIQALYKGVLGWLAGRIVPNIVSCFLSQIAIAEYITG